MFLPSRKQTRLTSGLSLGHRHEIWIQAIVQKQSTKLIIYNQEQMREVPTAWRDLLPPQ